MGPPSSWTGWNITIAPVAGFLSFPATTWPLAGSTARRPDPHPAAHKASAPSRRSSPGKRMIREPGASTDSVLIGVRLAAGPGHHGADIRGGGARRHPAHGPVAEQKVDAAGVEAVQAVIVAGVD